MEGETKMYSYSQKESILYTILSSILDALTEQAQEVSEMACSGKYFNVNNYVSM